MGGCKQTIQDWAGRNRPFKPKGFVPADADWPGPVLRMYMIGRVLVFVSGRTRRPDALFPEDTSGRQIALRYPRFRLPHEEQPAAQLDRRRVIRRDAILHIGAIPLTRGRDQLKR